MSRVKMRKDDVLKVVENAGERLKTSAITAQVHQDLSDETIKASAVWQQLVELERKGKVVRSKEGRDSFWAIPTSSAAASKKPGATATVTKKSTTKKKAAAAAA